mmetsp:Transcript_2964/g.6424  ORF Transcript_2964/g.6424 Transcript_2964/m.6424 type:complete len:372 (+) Transcript_2964:594-1709(+)|eukprot:CAMPEP_0178471514 /NCGR_PEP_ID=MMETSP0696-20121128/1083_1 /TAXON_ID=265572 /ORGANISM="Extubocellulus spinifer, Strain CCMP396" /LENGTH=371 /DNA_ID=CAMNT_0020098653 /DNA_START=255 /DNA_END=1370 /DNA_ORIENTATION=+
MTTIATKKESDVAAATSIDERVNGDGEMNDLCILLRLENKIGTPAKRILLSNLVDKTWDALALEAICRTYPDDQKPLQVSDYVVTMKDCGDKDWPVDIDNSGDLELATMEAMSKKCIKISAHVRRKSDSVPSLPESPASVVFVSSPVASSARSTIKRPIASVSSGAVVSPAKRRKSAGGGTRKIKGSVSARILGSLGQLLAIGIENAPRIQVALFSGYSNVSSTGFAKAISQLKGDGLIEYPNSKTVRFTAAGRKTEYARSVTAPKDNDAVHARIKSLLKPIQIRMFDLLADGVVHTREQLASDMGYGCLSSTGFAKSLSSMSSLGLIHYPKDDADKKKKLVQLTSICFPFEQDDGAAFRAATPPIVLSVF